MVAGSFLFPADDPGEDAYDAFEDLAFVDIGDVQQGNPLQRHRENNGNMSRQPRGQDNEVSEVRRVCSELSMNSRRSTNSRRSRRSVKKRSGAYGEPRSIRRNTSRVSFECHGSVIFDDISQLVDEEIASEMESNTECMDGNIINCEIRNEDLRDYPERSGRMTRCESEISMDSILVLEDTADASVPNTAQVPAAALGGRIRRNLSCTSLRPTRRTCSNSTNVPSMRRARSTASFMDFSMRNSESSQVGGRRAPLASLPRRFSFECHNSVILEELSTIADEEEARHINNSRGGMCQRNENNSSLLPDHGLNLSHSPASLARPQSMTALVSIVEGGSTDSADQAAGGPVPPAHLPRRLSFECHSSAVLEELGAMADLQQPGHVNMQRISPHMNENNRNAGLPRSSARMARPQSMLSLASIVEDEYDAPASVIRRMERGIIHRASQEGSNMRRSRSELNFHHRRSTRRS